MAQDGRIDSTGVSRAALPQQTVVHGKKQQAKTQSFDFLNEIKKRYGNLSAADVSGVILKQADKSAKALKLKRYSTKADNGMTWKQVQDNLKAYREKYLPKEKFNPLDVNGPYKGYVYCKQDGGIVKFHIDERALMKAKMSAAEAAEFDKVMAAYDELEPQMNKIDEMTGLDITNIKYPDETKISPNDIPEGYSKFY